MHSYVPAELDSDNQNVRTEAEVILDNCTVIRLEEEQKKIKIFIKATFLTSKRERKMENLTPSFSAKVRDANPPAFPQALIIGIGSKKNWFLWCKNPCIFNVVGRVASPLWSQEVSA